MRRVNPSNVIAVLLSLLVGRCTADLPPPPDPFVLCAHVPNPEGP